MEKTANFGQRSRNIIDNTKVKSRTPNEGFGVRRGVVSWDTSQDFGSSPPVRAFVKPRPTPSPDTLSAMPDDVQRLL